MPAAAAPRRRCRSSACAASLVAATASGMQRGVVQCYRPRQRTHVALASAVACCRRPWCLQQQGRRCRPAVRAPPCCWPAGASCSVLRPAAKRVVSTGVHAGDAPRCSHDTPMPAAVRSAVLAAVVQVRTVFVVATPVPLPRAWPAHALVTPSAAAAYHLRTRVCGSEERRAASTSASA